MPSDRVLLVCTLCGAQYVLLDASAYGACPHCGEGVLLSPRLARAWREGVRAAREHGGPLHATCGASGCRWCALIRRSVQ